VTSASTLVKTSPSCPRTGRPLQPVYAAVFIDAIYVKVRDGQVGNRPFYAAIGVDLAGRRDVLGLWAGHGGGESAKFWLGVLTDLKNRGVTDVFFVVCDGLEGLPDAVAAVFPAAIVQACVIHLIRATLRYASRKYWDHLARDLRAIYTAPTSEAAWAAFEEREVGQALPGHPQVVAGGVGGVHPVPGLRRGDPPGPVLHERDRSTPATAGRSPSAGTSPPSRPPSRRCTWSPAASTRKAAGQARWTMRWKPALNAFAVTFADRMPAAETSNDERQKHRTSDRPLSSRRQPGIAAGGNATCILSSTSGSAWREFSIS